MNHSTPEKSVKMVEETASPSMDPMLEQTQSSPDKSLDSFELDSKQLQKPPLMQFRELEFKLKNEFSIYRHMFIVDTMLLSAFITFVLFINESEALSVRFPYIIALVVALFTLLPGYIAFKRKDPRINQSFIVLLIVNMVAGLVMLPTSFLIQVAVEGYFLYRSYCVHGHLKKIRLVRRELLNEAIIV